MIRIKPGIAFSDNCPHCEGELAARNVLWQGIHVCAVSECNNCGTEIISDLNVGQAFFTPYAVDLKRGLLFGNEVQSFWFGNPLLDSLLTPGNDSNISLYVEKFHCQPKVIILNCIDFLYGHSLLKLLNADIHLRENPDLGLIVIVPQCLRWMVPEGVAEIWTINITFDMAQRFYPRLDQLIHKECERFDEMYLSPAHSHPSDFDISRFTKVDKHDFSNHDYRITFIWREDRAWLDHRIWLLIGHYINPVKRLLLLLQNFKISRLLVVLRKVFPGALFTVAGFGTATTFPKWIDDQRVSAYNEDSERQSCQVYSESRLVIGVHGSNMLLPSAHAGLTIDLMPDDRWGNIAQDLLYQEENNRMTSYRYRYLPIETSLSTLSTIATYHLNGLDWFRSALACK